MARARIVGARSSQPLAGTWELAAVAPGLVATPLEIERLAIEWIPIARPLPAAASLRAAHLWDFDRPRDFDAEDWWYRCRFTLDGIEAPLRLRFGGLATIADVWLNGEHVLHSDGMFLEHAVDITPHARRGENVLVMCFHALATALAAAPKLPRARWRTPLVAHPALRWFRTSLLGRMPAWCPPVAPVGPWRPITMERSPITVERSLVNATVEGDDGVIEARLIVSHERDLNDATLTVGDRTTPLQLEISSTHESALTGAMRIPRIERWWPHTHGSPVLYPASLSIRVAGTTINVDLGDVGFRTLRADHDSDGNGFGLIVNDVPIFCRGVCWTPLDIARLTADASEYHESLAQLRDAGVNMIRIPGNMTYEADAFHGVCNALGIMVWQDLMFANMDYPWADEGFGALATREIEETLSALQSGPSLAVVCGSSEVDQQAAMLGLPPSRWQSDERVARIESLTRELAPGAVWLPTTPVGGTFPFQANVGVTHYYGVGAYRRPLDDARRSNVRFAAECLAFSNVPERAIAAELMNGDGRRHAHTRWKARVPRDPGADLDFEDIRDHYVERLFAIDAASLRLHDAGRYLTLGRIATGEIMRRTFAEWRRPSSPCRGGLVWFARDLWPGAGWGMIDAAGSPKSAYWYLKRAWAPVALLSTDEGLNGLWLHALNDTPTPILASLRVALYRAGMRVGPAACAEIQLPARSATSVHADALFDGFLDLTYAYRFGPPQHDVVASTIRDRSTGQFYASDCFYPGPIPLDAVDIGLVARTEPSDGAYTLSLCAERFAHAIAIDVDGFVPDDNYFHLEPGETKTVALKACVAGAVPRGRITALNCNHEHLIQIEKTAHAS